MKRGLSWSLLVAALLLVLTGCQQQSTTETGSTTGGNDPVVEGDNGDTSGENSALPESDPVPDDVKTDAAEYLGVTESRRNTYTFTQGGEEQGSGSETVNVKVNEGKTTVEVIRDGKMMDIGNETLELTKDGVLTVGLGMGTLEEPFIQAPADLKEGSTWTSKMTLMMATGTKMSIEVKSVAKGMETIKTPAGEYEALRVDATMSISQESTGSEAPAASKTTSSSWYAKGIGPVKLELIDPKDGQTKIEILLNKHQEQ